MEINGVPLLDLQTPGGQTTNLTETFDDFLTLLTTQLQYQDPLEPLDTNQFTEQLVQFANVEQAINTNTKLDQLIAAQGGNELTGALDYIGKTVTVEGTGLDLVDGGATLAYDLSGAASAVTVLVLDSLGQPVASLKGPSGTGPQEIVWDGKDDQGNQLPDGTYVFSVQAVDAQGDPVALKQGSVGRVSGLELVNGEVILTVGSLQVTLNQILSVREPASGGV